MKHRILIGAASLMTAGNAFAHNGEHSAAFIANVMHWLSSPTHSLFAVIASGALIAAAYKLSRKSRV